MNETKTAQKTAVPGTVMIIGAAGRMGSITVKTAAAHGIKTVPIDPKNPDFPKMPQVTEEISAIIDFSLPTATEETLEYAKKRKIPAVIAATGHTEREYLNILKAAEIIPVFRAVNLSPGMEIICRALSLAAEIFPEADISVTEIHGKNKRDKPSGSAIMLSDTVKAVRGRGADVSSIRCGNAPGIHEVRICTECSMITLTHGVYDRTGYAEGALRAAEFLAGRKPGLYGMADLFPEKRGKI